ncbi:hypothetical protein [Hymenobacter qilianensis]|uniref:hypothetical protein n=1 Tax=Hymenobacter qilianensis TaxID=1385715 RepID=UPI001CB8DC67|nr:hypothetical protein [Hymenobacter qilianensis]
MITFSLASFDLNRTQQELFTENKMMMDLPRLHQYTDSLHKRLGTERQQQVRMLNPYYVHMRLDTTGQAANQRVANWQVSTKELPPSRSTKCNRPPTGPATCVAT